MPFSHEVKMADGSIYTVKQLLAGGLQNTKTAKSDKAGKGIITKSLSLAPAHASGYNLCTSASDACVMGCLYTSGFAAIHPRTIQPARIAKARFLRQDKEVFRARLENELSSSLKTAKRKGVSLAVRLNVLSDVMWEKEMPGIFDAFPEIQFYDYTKHYLRMMRYVKGQLPANLHLTFSWSGQNIKHSLTVLASGGNVATPFHVKYRGDKRQPLPATFLGFPIIDGDITDLRFLDAKGGNVVGLRAKGKAKKDFESGFVIPVKDGRPVLINAA